MGRTIPSFRIAAVLEEKTWKSFRKYLNKKDRKIFDNMFSISRLYNSACSYSVIPIRIYPIMMSIIFHNYKTSLNKSFFRFVDDEENKKDDDNNINSLIIKKELDKWKTYSDILRKPNRDLFNQMLQLSLYKYSNAIEAKGEQFSTESLIISLLLEQYKMII